MNRLAQVLTGIALGLPGALGMAAITTPAKAAEPKAAAVLRVKNGERLDLRPLAFEVRDGGR